MSAAGQTPKDTLFYDGQCPLCASEIAELRERRGEQLALVDIHDLAEAGCRPADDSGQKADRSSPQAARPCDDRTAASGPGPGSPDKDLLLRTLHLQKSDGSWLTGADANVAAWQGTKRGRLLAVLRWPLLRHAVDAVYSAWAWWRYRRLYGKQFEEKRHATGQR